MTTGNRRQPYLVQMLCDEEDIDEYKAELKRKA